MKIEYRHLDWVQLIWDTTLTTKAKVTAAYLSIHMNRHQQLAWPALDTIAVKTSQSRRSVIRAIQELESTGWLKVKHGGPKKGSNRYSPSFPKAVDKWLTGGDMKSLGGDMKSPDIVSEGHQNQLNRISKQKLDPISLDGKLPTACKNSRQAGTNPRALGTNPRAQDADQEAEKKIRDCKFPDTLANLCRHYGLGNPPRGMLFDDVKSWALEKLR